MAPQASVKLADFDINKVSVEKWDNPADTKGVRYRVKYTYSDGRLGPLVLAINPTVLPFGVTPPWRDPKETEPQPAAVDKDFQCCFGVRGVKRNQDNTGFDFPADTSPHMQLLYNTAYAIDTKVMQEINKKNQHARLQFGAVRSSVDKVTNAMEMYMIHTHVNKDVAMDEYTEEGTVKQLGFDEACDVSKEAEAGCFVCPASGYVLRTDVSMQWRVNSFLFTKLGLNPKEIVRARANPEMFDLPTPVAKRQRAADAEEETVVDDNKPAVSDVPVVDTVEEVAAAVEVQ